MADRQIIFSGPMVRALLEGRKTMTRRLLSQRLPSLRSTQAARARNVGHPYAVGDRLYVRESFRPSDMAPAQTIYRSDVKPEAIGPWTPSIHMPRVRSRLTLTVEAVKVERLQDISDADCLAEGVKAGAGPYDFDVPGVTNGRFAIPQDAFKALWQGLNAKRAPWDGNPWVVAITFKVHKCNIERMPA